VFVVAYEFKMLGNSNALSRRIDSGQVSLEDGAREYRALAAKSWFSMPLFPARNSLRERYVAEADRVLTDYREASESTPVFMGDWVRANEALNSAIGLAPEDRAVRGRSKVVLGYINLLHLDPKTKKPAPLLRTARADFEEARRLLPHSPDPHLGLAQIYMHDGELEQAETELNEAQSNGFRPGRREQKDLADTYRRRGEKYLATAARSHDVGQMQDALQKADADLSHALTLYNAIAPMPYGAMMAERVLNEREQAQKTLESARLVTTDPAKGNP